jgi:uncharacterized membrane protein (DUF485 family)
MSHEIDLENLAARRWRVALVLTVVMISAYFGFILLVAFDKPLMGQLILGGNISIGVLVGALVILLAPILTGIYVRWTNQHYDHAMAAIGVSRDQAHAAQAATVAVPGVAGLARARTPMPLPEPSTTSTTSPRPEVRS